MKNIETVQALSRVKLSGREGTFVVLCFAGHLQLNVLNEKTGLMELITGRDSCKGQHSYVEALEIVQVDIRVQPEPKAPGITEEVLLDYFVSDFHVKPGTDLYGAACAALRKDSRVLDAAQRQIDAIDMDKLAQQIIETTV